MGQPHDDETTDTFIPVYDFTSLEWSDITPDASRHNSILDMNMFVLINKAYGRWNESDDEKISAELERRKVLRQALDNTISLVNDEADDEIPF
jgi:hypothetical protein